MTELQSALLTGFSPGLVVNLGALLVAYAVWESLREWVRRELRYRRVRMTSLGFRSRVLFDDLVYEVGEITRYAVKLNGHDTAPSVFIPLDQWLCMVKRVPSPRRGAG